MRFALLLMALISAYSTSVFAVAESEVSVICREHKYYYGYNPEKYCETSVARGIPHVIIPASEEVSDTLEGLTLNAAYSCLGKVSTIIQPINPQGGAMPIAVYSLRNCRR